MNQDPTKSLGERLRDGADRFLKWAYKEPYSGPPVLSIPRHPDNIDALLCEAADALATLSDAPTEPVGAVNGALVEALRPFAAAAADADDGSVRGSATAWESPMAMAVTYGDFRRARAALRASAQKEAGNG